MNTFWRRTLVAATTLASATAGTLAITATTASAADTYDFEGGAFGSYVTTGPVGLQSSRTAHTYISCTRQIGYKVSRSAAGVLDNEGTPLSIGAIKNETRSYRTGDGSVGTISTSSVAGITLGSLSTLGLKIGALDSYSKAWADRTGTLHAESDFKPVRIESNTGTPLDDVLNGVSDGLGALLGAIRDGIAGVSGVPGQYIEIPGLGRLYLGSTVNDVPSKGKGAYARASAEALRIRLFGGDGRFGGTGTGADVSVVVARSRARIDRSAETGYFRGFGIGADVNVGEFQGESIVKVGPLGEQRLECRGTRGEIRTNAVAGLDLAQAGVLKVGAAQGRVYGKEGSGGTATAWGEGRVAEVHLGSGDTAIDLGAVIGKATVKRDTRGRLARSTGGTSVGKLTIGGQSFELPDPGQTLEIPGVAKLEFKVKELPNSRDVRAVAVRITLLGDTPLGSIIRLGYAAAGLRKA